MRHYLLPESGHDYKANLHCHSTCSDGRASPERIKQVYLDKGYSIVAYTDHDVFIGHNELTDEGFLALNGFEIGGTENGNREPGEEWDFMPLRCYHICYIAEEPDNLLHPCWHRTKYVSYGTAPWRDQVRYLESTVDYERDYTPKAFNDLVRMGKENGFYVTYNHPAWSLESYPEYSTYEGMDAVEIYNGGCYVAGHAEYNPRVYDDLLRQGKRVFVSGGDDNHATNPDAGLCGDCGIAWTVIRADKLEYRTVTRALEKGHFYASMGPSIHDLYVEDGKVHITTSEAAQITMNTATRWAFRAAKPDGSPITEATFRYDPKFGYLRLTVTDARGMTAVTNAYFCDTIPVQGEA